MTSREVLKEYFGYGAFREGQQEIIDAILKGRDVLAVMPTGAGKSICYQVPAMLLPGITIVISPLISLMQDQVKALNEAGIHAAYINSSLTENQVNRALYLAAEGAYRIIYVAPERLASYRFLEFAGAADISMVTVDEAHCISQWGQDFRPSYMEIVNFVRGLPKRPILSAFTATATEQVKEDINCILGLQDPLLLVAGFDRPNLFFSVESGKKKDAYVLEFVRSHVTESGIIYCATRKNTDALFELLFKEGISVARYHAGMSSSARKISQDDFVYDRALVMVATNAFGMGIDKSNVRYVIHYNMPQSMENYYQEAGRAGRDGEEAKCILLFSVQDVMIDRMLLDRKDFSAVEPEDVENIRERDNQRLRCMENYCRTTECLRNYILRYFGEKTSKPCGNCENCRKEYREVDMTKEAKWILNCVAETRGRFGINIVTGTLVGAKRARLKEVGAMNFKSYGALSDIAEGTLKEMISQMAAQEYLKLTDGRYSVLQMGPAAMRFRDESERFLMKLHDETDRSKESKKLPKSKNVKHRSDDLTSAGFQLFEQLRGLRMQLAREGNVPPYIVFSDKTLIEMCLKLPKNQQEMLAVNGVGAAKFEKYGRVFLQAIADFCTNPSSEGEDKK